MFDFYYADHPAVEAIVRDISSLWNDDVSIRAMRQSLKQYFEGVLQTAYVEPPECVETRRGQALSMLQGVSAELATYDPKPDVEKHRTEMEALWEQQRQAEAPRRVVCSTPPFCRGREFRPDDEGQRLFVELHATDNEVMRCALCGHRMVAQSGEIGCFDIDIHPVCFECVQLIRPDLARIIQASGLPYARSSCPTIGAGGNAPSNQTRACQ